MHHMGASQNWGPLEVVGFLLVAYYPKRDPYFEKRPYENTIAANAGACMRVTGSAWVSGSPLRRHSLMYKGGSSVAV